MRIGRHVEALIQDVRFSLRWLLRERAFTVTVLVTLALSIGSTTAVLTLVDVLLLRPLPVKSPERLFTLSEPGRDVDLNPSYYSMGSTSICGARILSSATCSHRRPSFHPA